MDNSNLPPEEDSSQSLSNDQEDICAEMRADKQFDACNDSEYDATDD